MRIIFLVLAWTAAQAPEGAPKEKPDAAMAWLARAEKALLDASAVRLTAHRTVTKCVAPETWIQKVEVTALLARDGRLRVDSLESVPGREDKDHPAVRVEIRCDGRTFHMSEAEGSSPAEAKSRTMPQGLAQNAAALFIRAGLEVAYLGWPVANFKGDALPATAFAVDKARVVEESMVGKRRAVRLEYEVSCFGKLYRHDLWIDVDTLAPLKRKCLETNLFDHARITGYEETYEPVEREVKTQDADFQTPPADPAGR